MIQTRQFGKEPYQVVNYCAHPCYEVSTPTGKKEVIHEIESTDVKGDADDNDERAKDGEEELDKC